ncbi:hypothetical protein ACFL2C_03800 [Patescibacteria group bacterium]
MAEDGSIAGQRLADTNRRSDATAISAGEKSISQGDYDKAKTILAAPKTDYRASERDRAVAIVTRAEKIPGITKA